MHLLYILLLFTVCNYVWRKKACQVAQSIQRPIVGMVTAGLFNVASSAFHWEVTVLIWV